MTNYNENTERENNLNILKLLKQMLKYWYFFPIFLTLTIAGVILYNKTTTPQYQISTRLLVSEGNDNQSSMTGGGENALPGINLGSQSNIENQLIILTSRRQIEKVLKQLDFTISYFKDDLFRTNEIYQESPFTVIPDTSEVKLSNLDFSVEFHSKDQFTLSLIHDNQYYSETHKFFEKISTPDFVFTIAPNEEIISRGERYIGRKFLFKTRTIKTLAGHYQSKIRLDRVTRESSIIEISITENNIKKGKNFLNKLAQNSVNYTLDKKNQIASNTIEFIERQLVGVMDSLAAAESVLEGFRSRNEVMDVSFQGQMIITQSNELENEKATLEARLDYLTYLLNNIENNLDINDIVAPSAMGVNDPVLNQLIGELASLNAEKSSLQFNTNIENPNIVRINHRIQTLRNSLLQTTRSIIETTQLSLNDLNKRLYQLSQEIRKLPKTEQTLLNIERKFRMNDEMYTYLLERRAEAQLAKSSNLPDHEIVEEAIARGQVTPDKTRSMLMIVVFGLMFPAVIVFLKVYNNDKIQDESEISELTNYPLIGTVPLHSDSNKRLVLEANSHSPLAEAFRNIRTSIGFYALEQPEKTILVTSSVPSEGKTVFAANLANSFAQLGKTTLLMGFDLRMPAINEEMFPDLKTPGLVHYLLGEKEWETLVQPSRTGNLNILTSGDIPPNPTELIANKKTDQLFTNLKKHFEIIIIDTPPVGLVSDAYLLTKYSDLTLLITRQNVTPKSVLKKCLNDEKMKKLEHVGIVLNGAQFERKDYSYYYNTEKEIKKRKKRRKKERK
ncbi:GumC family protein [Marinilabilia salmonicolor]|uniref:GumC family protein n=1 Tax=Marinilabilia salmonicolor TaxID=989 RepID=UPI00029A9D4B|nr:polysaccharide biosynthesis tyrosine autokinase [Marinilabilia salmonicolor]